MPTADDIKRIIDDNKDDIAFVIGNGINRFSQRPGTLSWEDLLIQLWGRVSKHPLARRPEGIALTEFYDVLELENVKNLNLQKEVSVLLQGLAPEKHHDTIITKIESLNAPVLTTNFEETLMNNGRYGLMRTTGKGFTDYYPWSNYYGNVQHNLPTDGFGIWHINGMIRYPRSIRLGLSYYMGSVERARNLIINRGRNGGLFLKKNQLTWNGHKTWLHIIFSKSLFVFGLGLDENEVFLRWLLIERYKYFKKFPDRKQKGWYITKGSPSLRDAGKRFFLERVGFEIIEVDNYEDLYVNIWE